MRGRGPLPIVPGVLIRFPPPLFVVRPASFVVVIPVHPVILAVLIVLVAGCPLPIAPRFHPTSSCLWPWLGVLCDGGGCRPLAVLVASP